MADDFEAGDRVRMRNGELGTVIRVDGGLAQIRLDSSLRKNVATAALEKIEGHEDASGSTGSATDSQNTIQETMPKIRVLLVEGDEGFAHLIKASLATSKLGFDVHVVDCPAAAVATLDKDVFNLVLLDLDVPDRSGLQTLEAVAAASSVPIVVLTSRVDERITDKLLASGADSVISKAELKTSLLIESMQQAVSRQRKPHPQELVIPSAERLIEELAESATGIERALAVFEHRRLDPAEDIALTSAKTHLHQMKTAIAKYRGG